MILWAKRYDIRSSLNAVKDEKAIQFIQAEKMYYETALIDTSLLQKKVGKLQRLYYRPQQ